jgi:hypothetical protein
MFDRRLRQPGYLDETTDRSRESSSNLSSACRHNAAEGKTTPLGSRWKTLENSTKKASLHTVQMRGVCLRRCFWHSPGTQQGSPLACRASSRLAGGAEDLYGVCQVGLLSRCRSTQSCVWQQAHPQKKSRATQRHDGREHVPSRSEQLAHHESDSNFGAWEGFQRPGPAERWAVRPGDVFRSFEICMVGYTRRMR